MRCTSCVVIGLLWLSASCVQKPPEMKKAATGPVAVRVAQVTTRELRRSVETVGTLYPMDEVIVSAEIEGPVDKVSVDLGDNVKTGAVLAHISDEEQRYILAQNEAQLRQSLERLGLKSETDRVKDIEQTPELRRARADLTEAEQRFKRVRNLVDQKIGAQADLDQSAARYSAMLAAYDLSRNQTRNLIQEVERFKALVELQRKKLRDTSVRAPFDASIKERQVSLGQFVRPNTPLFVLVKTNPVRLRLEVPERMAPWVREGQTAEVSVEAYADRKFSGRIWRISPTVDMAKRTFIVEALIDNPANTLKAGSYARVRIETQKVDVVKIVPARAIAYVLGQNRAYVVVGAKVQVRDVKLGDRMENVVEVTEGLEQGDTVAVTQLQRLDAGVEITVDSSPAKQKDRSGT